MLTPTKTPGEVIPPLRLSGVGRRDPRPSRSRRVRRIVLGAALVCLIPAFVSYVQAITAKSSSSLGIRTVEWLRDNGARGLVNRVENLYYTLTAPSKGGPALKALPTQAGTALVPPNVRARRHVHIYRP